VADIIQLRRDTASNWTSTNPTLASGELGLETDTGKLKAGDASTAWTSLGYYSLGTTGFAALAGATFTGVLNATGGLQLSGTSITADATELNILDGVTADKDEINKLDGYTGDVTDLNKLASVTSSATELNLLDGVSGLVQADLTKLAAVDASASELDLLNDLSRGSILYGNASGATTVLTKGTSAQVLTSDGTDISWQNAGAASVVINDSTANTNFPVVFHNESNLLFDDTGALRYNPSTGELLVPNLTVAGTTTTANTVTMNAANAIVFEGATADSYETTLSVMDPTSDHTQYLINQGGYIPVLAASTTTAITSTPAELNVLDGIPSGLTATELGYVDGVTSSIQTQLNAAGSMNNVVEDTTPQLGGNLDVQSSEIITSTSNGNIKVTPNGSGVFEVKGAGGNDGTLQLNCSANSHGVKIKSPPHSAGASYTLTLPNNDGDADQVLKTDGSGALSWDEVGYKNVPQNSQSAAYTCVLTDSGKHIHHPSTDATARTYTIPANSSVAYPIGTAITFTNMTTQVVTIAITADTMHLAADGATGNRALAQYGMATALKIGSTKWLISGNGLT
jgi:hypothetical protein